MTAAELDMVLEVMERRGVRRLKTNEFEIDRGPVAAAPASPEELEKMLERLVPNEANPSGVGPKAGYLGQEFEMTYGARHAGPRTDEGGA